MKQSTITALNINDTIFLRVLDLSDAEAYFDLIDRNRTYLRAWLGWVNSIENVQNAEDDLRSRIIAFHQGKKCLFGIFYHDELVGRITFSRQLGEVNIGYFIDETHQGKGIVTRALNVALKHGFEELGVHRFVLACQDTNKGSKAVAQRLGFTFEGVARQKVCLYGTYFDLNVYSLINKQ